MVERGPSATYPYRPDQQAVLQDALADARDPQRPQRPARASWPRPSARSPTGTPRPSNHFCEAGLTASEIDVIGFHGQTVIHRPERRLTVQLGVGHMLARRTGCRVVYDMRAADVAAGGQGAPLVPVYHRALAASLPERPVAFVNIGGVANMTWIGPTEVCSPSTPDPATRCSTTGAKRIGAPFDEGGRLAAAGKVDRAALAQLLGHDYFEDRPPKSLDRNSFAGLSLDHLSDADGAATLLEFTRASVLQARDWFPEEPRLWVVCGGGRRNLALMDGFPGRGTLFRTAEEAGFDGDSMEAEAWAYLAVRALKGLPLTFPGTTGIDEPLTGGRLAEPQ